MCVASLESSTIKTTYVIMLLAVYYRVYHLACHWLYCLHLVVGGGMYRNIKDCGTRETHITEYAY